VWKNHSAEITSYLRPFVECVCVFISNRNEEKKQLIAILCKQNVLAKSVQLCPTLFLRFFPIQAANERLLLYIFRLLFKLSNPFDVRIPMQFRSVVVSVVFGMIIDGGKWWKIHWEIACFMVFWRGFLVFFCLNGILVAIKMIEVLDLRLKSWSIQLLMSSRIKFMTRIVWKLHMYCFDWIQVLSCTIIESKH
jgi:hypothetical protein